MIEWLAIGKALERSGKHLHSRGLAERRLRRGLDNGYIASRGRDENGALVDIDTEFWRSVSAVDAADGTITTQWMAPPGPYHGLRDMVEHSAQRFAVEIRAEDMIVAGMLPATKAEPATAEPKHRRKPKVNPTVP
jgi:hypothetical protein